MKDSKKHSTTLTFLFATGRLVRSLLTSTYIGAYRYHTLDPIEKIHEHQDGKSKVARIEALADFRRLKEEELAFVAKAVSQIHVQRCSCIHCKRADFYRLPCPQQQS